MLGLLFQLVVCQLILLPFGQMIEATTQYNLKKIRFPDTTVLKEQLLIYSEVLILQMGK